MNKLTKEQKTAHAAHVEALSTKRAAVVAAADAFNDAIREARAVLDAVVDSYNEAVEEAQAFVDEITDAIGEFRGEKTERWEDGNGDRYNEWENELSAIRDELEPIEIDEVDEVEVDDAVGDFVDAFPFAVGDKD